jgi:hypothetical protein
LKTANPAGRIRSGTGIGYIGGPKSLMPSGNIVGKPDVVGMEIYARGIK